jgi:hypothetical protein
MPSHNQLLQALFKFWTAYHKNPNQMAKWCPFTEYSTSPCHELCYVFEYLCPPKYYSEQKSSGSCPCHAYGAEGALQRLEEVLREGGYYLDMREETRVVTIVPCKECHEHPCTCALLGPTKE